MASARDNQNRSPDFFCDDVVLHRALAKLESDLARHRGHGEVWFILDGEVTD